MASISAQKKFIHKCQGNPRKVKLRSDRLRFLCFYAVGALADNSPQTAGKKGLQPKELPIQDIKKLYQLNQGDTMMKLEN